MATNSPFRRERWEKQRDRTAKNGFREKRSAKPMRPLAAAAEPDAPVNADDLYFDDKKKLWLPNLPTGKGSTPPGDGSYAGIARTLYSLPFYPTYFMPAPDRSPFTDEVAERFCAAAPRTPQKPAPDYVELITAWRAWAVTPQAGEWRLRALGMREVWQPRKPMTADCLANADNYSLDRANHLAPHFSCECGIWSFHSLKILIEAMRFYKESMVIGQVSIWGRIVECENGYRSQFAYPKELWLLDKRFEQLGYTYGVPIRTIEP